MSTRREQVREATYQEIKRVAYQQMREHGATSLSLRAIAAEMGVTAPALYRYFANRDELVTALIVDAYNSLGVALEEASLQPPGEEYGTRFLAVTLAFRLWALTNREEFILIYGTPIPGYQAPAVITTPAAWRSNRVFMQLLEDAWRTGQLTIPSEYLELSNVQHSILEAQFTVRGFTMPSALLNAALTGWGQIHGLVSLELYGHQDYMGEYPAELYRVATLAYIKRLGLKLTI